MSVEFGKTAIPVFVNINGHNTIHLFGGSFTAASVDTEGSIFYITEGDMTSGRENFAKSVLPSREKPVSIACCYPLVVANDTSGRTLSSLGMKYVHARGIIHRDMKPSNILFGSNSNIKIIDFGIARLMTIEGQSSLTHVIGTQKFMAPEIFDEDDDYNEKVDVYSFGVVLAFFVLNNGDISKINASNIFKGKKIEVSESFSPFAKRLISDCLSIKAKNRPSFSDIVSNIESNSGQLISLSKFKIKGLKNTKRRSHITNN